jgi:hypothetical protein
MPGECFPEIDKSRNSVGVIEKEMGESRTYGSPNDHSTRNLGDGFIGHLEDHALLLDLLDHRLGQDVDLGFFEGRLGILDEGLAEHRQHGWESLHKRDLHSTGQLRVPGFEILLQEIVKLATVRANQKGG